VGMGLCEDGVVSGVFVWGVVVVSDGMRGSGNCGCFGAGVTFGVCPGEREGRSVLSV